jgi:formylglycine-generating enzyme required for sulfatase activity
MKNLHTKSTLDHFCIGKHLVTHKSLVGGNGGKHSAFFEGLESPVETISWDDVEEFLIQKLNNRTGKKPIASLTEAEWEYAAKGGQKSER